ncbi:MAG TPA: zf-HC2 domain-containing protein [Armatimonadota bacterium]|nr:zf-HC2 domain-containing protein [Armatimonadota bacterium]HQK92720.1 zf-HC2 domain-containing protein [Armatimonadota bacterium]
MTCREARDLVRQHLAGTLDAAWTSHLERHLATCDACETLLDELLALQPGTAGEAIPEGLHHDVLALVIDQPAGLADDCYLMAPLLSAAIDGELDHADAATLQVHLDGCVSCRGALERMRSLNASIRALPWAEPPRALDRRIHALIPMPSRSLGRRVAAWLRRLPAAARPAHAALPLAAAAALALIIALPRVQQPSPTALSPTVGPASFEGSASPDVEMPAVVSDTVSSPVAPQPAAPARVAAVGAPSPRPRTERAARVLLDRARSVGSRLVTVATATASAPIQARGSVETVADDVVVLKLDRHEKSPVLRYTSLARMPELYGYEPDTLRPDITGLADGGAPRREPMEAVAEVVANLDHYDSFAGGPQPLPAMAMTAGLLYQ